ncbi:MAG TPA: hypothetical protein VG942_19235 [Hyphomonadaceae bacterium]|nr:hypothetical protein [Hyphomonadaceae bacterium]
MAKKLARDYAQKKKSSHMAVFQAASMERDAVLEVCVEHQKRASESVGRIGISRIESMRRVLPQTVHAAKACAEKGYDDTAFKGEGWFSGRSPKSLFGLAASLIAVDLVLPEDSPHSSAEVLLSSLAAQGAYSAFETLPHHEGIDPSAFAITPHDLNEALLHHVGAVDEALGKVDDLYTHAGIARDSASLAGAMGVEQVHQISDTATQLATHAADMAGHGVVGAVTEVTGALDVLGDFIGQFASPVGWALAGWGIGGLLHQSKKIATKREEVNAHTTELGERTERAKRIIARGEEIEAITPEASYQAFKHAWIMKQVTSKRFRDKAGKERDVKRAKTFAKVARDYWQIMNAPVLAKGGDAADTPLKVAA